MKQKGKSILAGLMAMLTVITSVFTSAPTIAHAESDPLATVIEDTQYVPPGHMGSPHYTLQTSGGKNLSAICVHPEKKSPGKGTRYSNRRVINDNELLRKVMYYGTFENNGYNPSKDRVRENLADKPSGSYTIDQAAYLYTHYIAAVAYRGRTDFMASDLYNVTKYCDDRQRAQDILNLIASYPAPPDDFVVTEWYNSDPYQVMVSAAVENTTKPKKLMIHKTSTNPSITDDNSCYSLAGAQYTVYDDRACTRQTKDINGDPAVLTTDSSGNSNTVTLGLKTDSITVYIKETKAPTGYYINDQPIEKTLSKEGSDTVVIETEDVPGDDPVRLILSKKDSGTGENKPAGAASLEGAQYIAKYYDTVSDTDPAKSGMKPKRTWVFKTDEDGKIYFTDSYKVSGDALYQQNKKYVLPLGTVTFTEKEAPTGYQKNPDTYVVNTEMDAASRRVITTNLPTEENAVKEQVFRGDFRIRKIEASSGRTLANIPFRITSIETGEHHDIMTDENGVYDSSSSFVKHSHDTNGGKSTSGLWFTGESTGSKTPVDDSLGALPYGNYKIEELPCKENEKYVPFNDTFTVSRNNYTVDFNTIPNWDKPEIASDATGDLGNSHFAMSDTGMSINDRVVYNNITENALKYYGVKGTSNLKMVSKVYDKTAGSFVKKSDGKDLSVEKIFDANRQSGSISMMITVDSSKLAGHTLVVYEYLYGKSADGSDVLLAKEEDPNEESQMIFIPKIETNATEKTIGDHFLKAGSAATVNDTIKYTNLPENKTLFIDGRLVDAETGETVKDATGKAVENTLKVTTVSQNGTFVNSFSFKVPSEWEGRKFVIYETVRDRGNMIYTSEEDANDKNQTLYVPKIRTHASDGNTKDHVGTLSKTATFVDSVSYQNLIIGKTYTVTGTLHIKESGEVLKDAAGKPVTATKTFTADKSNGSINLTFTFDSSLLEGKTLVAFEDVKHKNISIGSHNDINDEEQSVHYPKIRTKAIDKYTGDHVGTLFGKVQNAVRNMLRIEVKGKQTIEDTVLLSNLQRGEKYSIAGVLVNKATGKPVFDENGNQVIGTSGEFSATSENMSKTVTYTLDASKYENTTFVVFETLTHKGVDVAKHADVNDEDQSIYNMESHTTYVSGETKDHVGVVTDTGKMTSTVDTVSVNNLRRGDKYTVTGTLRIKENGEVLKDAAGKPVTAAKTFTAGDDKAMTITGVKGNAVSGNIDLTFVYDSSLLSGKTVVAFETVDHNGKTIYVHADLNDESQSVHYPDLSTTAIDSKTGDHVGTSDGVQTITDAVKMTNLIPGQKYSVKGSLYNVTKNEIIKGSEKTLTFTADKANEIKNINFNIDTTKVEGETVVVLENLYHADVLIKSHQDKNDKDQMIHYPKIRTKAIDKTTGDHVGTLFGKVQNAVRNMLGISAEEKQTIVDTIIYQNLIPGQKYSISGVLVDKTSGAAVKDSNGNIVTGTTGEFVADKIDGTKEISYSVDASKYENTTFVVFETLTHKGVDVAKHADVNDEDQSIYNMESHTTYVSGETKDHVGVVTDTGKMTSTVDTVSVNNLRRGDKYTVTGTLRIKENGEVLKDAAGKPVTAAKTFTAGDDKAMTITGVKGNAVSGNIDLTFVYDSSLLSGKTVVAFETVDHNGKTIYVHADLNDESQSVHYPDLSTKALNKITKDQTGNLGTTKVEDTVAFINLIPGQKYTVRGKVYDLDADKVLSESDITFTAKKSNDKVIVPFTVKVNEDMEGHTLVVMEDLYHADVLVKSHQDKDDKDQMIYIPKIRTNAVDGKSGTHSGIIGSTSLIDTVSYKNLIPGKSYTVFAELMNAKTGEKMIGLDGKYMECKKTFTAKKADGSIKVTFSIDSRLLKDTTVVAFETLYREGEKVAVHTDINDKNQSVHYPGMGTSATVNNSHYASTSKKTRLVDRVWYQNLIPGHTYRVEGTLMDKSTNLPILINGGEVVVKKDFVPDSAYGYVDMEFTFNSSSLDKHTVVVFEHMYDGKVLLTSHADINDTAQSVQFNNAPPTGIAPPTGDNSRSIPYGSTITLSLAGAAALGLLARKKKKGGSLSTK